MDEREVRFRDEHTELAGITGEVIELTSANPTNFHHAITDTEACEPMVIDGKLFHPGGAEPLATVVIVPGSLGVGPNHLLHAQTLLEAGAAVFVLDPFGSRSVVSTVGNQAQYSFAASAFDVAVTVAWLAEHPAVDVDRIAVQGHSRGGSAVLTASMRRFADAVMGPHLAVAGCYAVYPWVGYQFADPTVGSTRVRSIVGELDDWVSIQQIQAQTQAISLAGGDASFRLVVGAAHSFDRLEPVHELPDARVAPAAPTVTLADDGAMIDPRTGEADPALTDYDLFVAAIAGGFGRQGAHIGGVDDQPELFSADMLAFHTVVLGLG